jgi:hypothetical protein
MPIYALVDTWNSAGTTFTGIGLNVTDTASAAGSLLLDLQVGGSSRFSVRKGGQILAINGTGTAPSYSFAGASSNAVGMWLYDQNTLALRGNGVNTGINITQDAVRLGTNPLTWGGDFNATDLQLHRDAADTLAQRRSTNAQAHRWYRSFTDASNYSRVYLGWSSSTAILATEGAGTGSRGNIAFGTAALATSATVGYVMIPSSAGAPTGVPADIPTGQVALHYDTSNNKIYVYNGGWVFTAALT